MTISVEDLTTGQLVDYTFGSADLEVKVADIVSPGTNYIVRQTFNVGKWTIVWESDKDDGSFPEIVEKVHDLVVPTSNPTSGPTTSEPTNLPTLAPTPEPTQPKTASCDPYYTKVSRSLTFLEAEAAAPEGCVLAPVHSISDLDAMAAAAGQDECWTGIATDAPATGGSVNGWYNLFDKTIVDNRVDFWKTGEPNNSESPQTRATINRGNSKRLRDVKASEILRCAVYLCCQATSDVPPTTTVLPATTTADISTTAPPPITTVPPPPSTGTGEKSIDDFVFAGAFRVNNGRFGGTDDTYTLNYSKGTMAIDPARNSLFITSHDHRTMIAEFPLDVTPGFATDVRDLPQTSGATQNFLNVFSGVSNNEGLNRITGMMVVDNSLIVNAETWYDGAADNRDTTLVFPDAGNLAGNVDGLFQMSCAANCAGYMGHIPPVWQSAFGGAQYFSGWSSVYGIAARYSQGPSLWTMNPNDIVYGDASVNPAIETTAYMNYAYNTCWLSPDANGPKDGGADGLWNTLSSGVFGFFVPNSSTFAVIGSNGGINSGIGYKIRGCGGYCSVDPDDDYNYYWFYDINDILAAANPCDIRPYSHGIWNVPYDDNGNHKVTGATFDHEKNKLYVALRGAAQIGNYDRPPLIVTFEFK